MDIKLIPDFVEKAAGKPAQAIGNTLSDIWTLGIGGHVSLWVEKQRIRQQKNLEEYKKEVERKTQAIPEEYLTEPQLHIVGPAIEASKYYVESKELREMFASLIASSIDIRKTGKNHPSFVEIIKQLSPLDANILRNLKEYQNIPISRIKFANDQKGFEVYQSHVMNFINNDNYAMYASSLSNLERLGLIIIKYDTYIIDENAYNYVNKHPAYLDANKELEKNAKTTISTKKVDFDKGLCTRTPLCEDFISVCL